jgi:hypothetical protein
VLVYVNDALVEAADAAGCTPRETSGPVEDTENVRDAGVRSTCPFSETPATSNR